jgi:hypothetical protein
MNCEFYKSEMYAWRPGSDAASFRPLFDHLAGCPECAQLFEQLIAADQRIQSTFQKIPENRSLESRILGGWPTNARKQRYIVRLGNIGFSCRSQLPSYLSLKL